MRNPFHQACQRASGPRRRDATFACGLALSIACALCGSSASASPRTIIANQSAVVVPPGFVVVPFAVPVAVPSYVQYEALPQHQAVVSDQGPVVSDKDRPPVTEHRLSATDRQPLASVHCAKCHSGEQAKKEFRVDQPLSDSNRLKAIARILADDPQKRMPKGTSLDAETLGKLIQELSQKKTE